MNVLKKFLSKFFSCYCWVGILFILISIIINLAYPEQPFIIKVLMELLNTIGISIFVAALFTWATDSVAFLQKVQELLKSVVIDRSFLRNLDFKSKSDVLELLIKPSNFEKSIYTNIDDYYNFYIKHTLEISQKNVRSDYHVNARIYFDNIRNKVMCEKTFSYRLYPTIRGFEDIKIGFSDFDIEGKIFYVRIWNHEGQLQEFNDLQLNEDEIDGEKMHITSINMSNYSIDNKHLVIEFKIQECGYDHWYMPAIQILQPTDGISYNIKCEDGIRIKTCDVFGQGVNFKTEKNSDDTEISISAYQWLNEGAGICVVVSKK